jgi:acetoin utilization deacetylase AcuC-like enzyme
MKTFFAKEQKRHDPSFFLSSGAAKPNPEQPERVELLLAGARAAGAEIVRPKDHGLAPVSAVHTPEYLDFLSRIYERWQRIEGASSEVIPNIHPIVRTGSYPASAVGQAGYHMADTSCPISEHTFESALWSASTAVSAAEAVMAGEKWSYALCRPPGHHAFRDVAGGFCFFNNSGIAAQHLLGQAKRVALLDVDLHHGNGTQGVFYERADVLTVLSTRTPRVSTPSSGAMRMSAAKGLASATISTCRCRASRVTTSFSMRWPPQSAASKLFRRMRLSWRSASMPSEGTPSAGYRFRRQAFRASRKRSARCGCPLSWCRRAAISATNSATTSRHS